MKKLKALTTLFFIIFSINIYAAKTTLDDLSGTWSVLTNTKILVNRLGIYTEKSSLVCSLESAAISSAGRVTCQSDSEGTVVSSVTLSPNGKKLFWSFDPGFISNLAGQAVSDYSANKVVSDGGAIQSNIAVEITGITYIPFLVNKRSITNGRVNVKGSISATVDGRKQSSPFAYTLKATFRR